jgi:hypothetical protein
LLFLRLFPAFLRDSAAHISERPWRSLGVGVIGLIAAIAVAIGCILLLVLSIIMSPVFGIVSAIASSAFYALLVLLAAMPVALWLGSLILGERSAAYQLLMGVIVLKAGLFALMLLGLIPAVGAAFGVLSFLAKMAILFLGAGALLHAMRTACARKPVAEGQ